MVEAEAGLPSINWCSHRAIAVQRETVLQRKDSFVQREDYQSERTSAATTMRCESPMGIFSHTPRLPLCCHSAIESVHISAVQAVQGAAERIRTAKSHREGGDLLRECLGVDDDAAVRVRLAIK